MRRTRVTVEYVLPPRVDPGAVVSALGSSFTLVEDERSSTRTRTFLDTFDRRLRAGGVTAELDGGRLTLRIPGVRPLNADVNARDGAIAAAALPQGALRERVAPLIEMRALLALVSVRSSVEGWRVLDGADKTVVRVAIETPEVRRPGEPPLRLATRLHVTPVLGYDKQLERVLAWVARELRLARPAAPLLDEALAAAGPPPHGSPPRKLPKLEAGQGAGAAALTMAAALAKAADANLAGTLADLDSEFLHDLRVAVRRARSVLKELKAHLPAEPLDAARSELKWLQQATGRTRDLDVQLLEWPDLAGELDARVAADLAPLHALLGRHRAAALEEMRGELEGGYERARAAWQELLDSEPAGDTTIAAAATKRIRRVARALVKDGRRIGDDSPAEALHDLRKRGKELRYLLELFGSVWEGDDKALVAELKRLQDVLGRFQDLEVQSGFLRALGPELAKGRGGSDALLALGVVLEHLRERQQAARADFAKRFKRFARAAEEAGALA